MGIEEGTFWDEHWVLYGNQFDNKLHILKKKRKKINKSCVFSRNSLKNSIARKKYIYRSFFIVSRKHLVGTQQSNL